MAEERNRIDRLKKQLEEDEAVVERFEQQRIDIPPSALRKFGRRVLDIIGVYPKASEERRDRESMPVALEEYRQEKEKRRLAQEAQAELEERGKLEEAMSGARTIIERNKRDFFSSQRVQELIERELTAKLTTIEHLEEEVLSENPEVSKRFVEFDGVEVPIFDLKGIPYVFLSHAVDYRYANYSRGVEDIGNQTAQDLLEDPSLWMRTREEVESLPGYGTRRVDATGDTISASYVNSEFNPESRYYAGGNGHYATCYGFAAISPDSIINIFTGDAASSNVVGRKKMTDLTRGDVDAIQLLENHSSHYNEILLRRYDESGHPKKPDYIISVDGHVTDSMLRAAKFFGVPVVNIESQIYRTKLQERSVNAIRSVGDDSSYSEILDAKRIAERSPELKGPLGFQIEHYGCRRFSLDIDGHSGVGEMGKMISDFQRLEFKKRIDYIAAQLEKAIFDCERANAAKEVYDVDAFNRQMHIQLTDASRTLSHCNELRITLYFREGGSVFTCLYDGEHVKGGGESDPSDDSGPYERISSLVMKFSALCRENMANNDRKNH